MVDCGPRFAILYWTVYYQCKIPVSGKSEPIILKKLDLFSWKFHEIHTQRSLVMRAQKLLYVFARRYQMISACMTVSVRELRTAVREWACWYKVYNIHIGFIKNVLGGPDQTAHPCNLIGAVIYHFITRVTNHFITRVTIKTVPRRKCSFAFRVQMSFKILMISI